MTAERLTGLTDLSTSLLFVEKLAARMPLAWEARFDRSGPSPLEWSYDFHTIC